MQALIPLPPMIERFIRLPAGADRRGSGFSARGPRHPVPKPLFPGFTVRGRGMFRLIRDTGVDGRW